MGSNAVRQTPGALRVSWCGPRSVALLVGFGLVETPGGAQLLADVLILLFGGSRAPLVLGVVSLIVGFPLLRRRADLDAAAHLCCGAAAEGAGAAHLCCGSAAEGAGAALWDTRDGRFRGDARLSFAAPEPHCNR